MSEWDKMIARICGLSKDLRFDELRKVYVEMVRQVLYYLRGDHRKCSGKCGGCKKGMAGGSFGGRNRNLRAGWSGSVFRPI